KTVRLLDVRSREEFEAVHIEGSILMSQPLTQEIMAEGTNSRPLVVVDHQGKQGLDAAAYFMGHGLTNVRCLRGGIDAWSREVDTVGNSECGEMLRMWIKYKEDRGKKVIDKATFQSFGCETAIAVASLATELIKGKTAEEALSLKTNELAGDLGPLPPMKIHCAELVQGALRSALEPQSAAQPSARPVPPAGQLTGPLESINKPKEGGLKVVFLNKSDE